MEGMKIMKDRIIESLHRKIDEVYCEFQRELGINSGDIDPWSELEQDKLIDQLAEAMVNVLAHQMPK